MRFAAGLYPAAWRARYGEEFEALLEDVGPVWRDVWNVLGGALKMQIVTWSFWKLVPALGMAGAIAAGVAAFTMRTEYLSSGVMRVTPMVVTEAPGEGADLAMAQRVENLRLETLSRTSLAKIIAEENLYPAVIENATIEDAVARMQRDVMIAPFAVAGGRSTAFRLAFRYPDPSQAQRVTRKLMSQIVDANVTTARESPTPTTVEVLDFASQASPIWPNRPVMIGVGLAAGLLLGLIAVGVRRRPMMAAWAAGGALLAMAASVALSFALPIRYQSSAALRTSGREMRPIVDSAMRRDTLAAVIQRNGLYRGEPIDRAIQRMQRDTVIQPYGARSALTAFVVRFTYGDRNQAQRVVMDLVVVIMEENRRLQGDSAGLVEVLDPPSLPATPLSPNRWSFAVLGLVAGVLLGPLALRFRRRTATA